MAKDEKTEDKVLIKDLEGKPMKKMRRIIIETDGDSIHIVSAEVPGRIELAGILEQLLAYVRSKKE